jgi:ribosome-binding factor A
MQGRRHDRVRELLKRELSNLLLREFPIAETGLLAVNEVRLSSDLKRATAYVGVVGNPGQRHRAFELLREHRLRLQSLLGHAVTLKYTPELHFVADDAVDRGNRVLQILDDLEKTLPAESP